MLSTVKCYYFLKYLHLTLLHCFKELVLLNHICKKSYGDAKGSLKLLKSHGISTLVVCCGILLNILDELLKSLFHPSDPLIPSLLISWQIPGNRVCDRHSTQSDFKKWGAERGSSFHSTKKPQDRFSDTAGSRSSSGTLRHLSPFIP